MNSCRESRAQGHRAAAVTRGGLGKPRHGRRPYEENSDGSANDGNQRWQPTAIRKQPANCLDGRRHRAQPVPVEISSAKPNRNLSGHDARLHRKASMFSSEELRLRTLVRAAELCGGSDRLAAFLGISHSQLASMIDGRAVPEDAFLRCVDLLTARNVSDLYKRATKTARQPADSEEV